MKNKYQRDFIFTKNHRKALNNTEQIVFYVLIFVFNTNRLHHCVIILKLWENTSLYNLNMTHEVNENHRKSLNNTEQMVFYELIFVFNRNRLHHCVLHTQMMGNHFFLQF